MYDVTDSFYHIMVFFRFILRRKKKKESHGTYSSEKNNGGLQNVLRVFKSFADFFYFSKYSYTLNFSLQLRSSCKGKKGLVRLETKMGIFCSMVIIMTVTLDSPFTWNPMIVTFSAPFTGHPFIMITTTLLCFVRMLVMLACLS